MELLIPLEQITPDPNQHRRYFDHQKLQELAETIKQVGLQQPITVRRVCTDRYRIVAGERRWRAHQIAGLEQIRANVVDVDDKTARQIQVIENLQRAEVNPLEEATAYRQLIDENPGWTSVDVAKAVGKTWNHVDTRLALCELHPNIQSLVAAGQVTVGEAYEMVRASRLLAERDGKSKTEVQFEILQAVKSGERISNVCRAITMQVAVNNQTAMFVSAPVQDERVKRARETMEAKLERLERLCSETWDYQSSQLTVSAFTGDLAKVLTRLELIEKHLARIRRDLQAEQTRRQLRKGGDDR